MFLSNLFESSFWKTLVHPVRLSLIPLLKAFWELSLLYDPKYTIRVQVFYCTVMEPSHFSPSTLGLTEKSRILQRISREYVTMVRA